MPRDLKEEDGWRFSSLRKMRLYLDQYNGSEECSYTYQPAAFDKTLDSTSGVSIQGFAVVGGSAIEPILLHGF